MDEQLLIDRYNEQLKKYQIPGKRSICPQCLVSKARELKGGRAYFECGSSLKVMGEDNEIVGGLLGSAKCWELARQRPLDWGNLIPWGIHEVMIPKLDEGILQFPNWDSYEMSITLSLWTHSKNPG